MTAVAGKMQRRRDSELATINRMLNLFDTLSPDGRERAIQYLSARIHAPQYEARVIVSEPEDDHGGPLLQFARDRKGMA
jgi:hypothetical protein